MPRKPGLLLTNDDGIHAPGLTALHSALRRHGRMTVAAPASQRSAVGHSITIAHPILCDRVALAGGGRGWSIEGTPADCVKLALTEILGKRRPDFVLSGINFGANLGFNVYYSGTVAAALEASFLGIPSFALSLTTKKDPLWPDAARVARRIVEEFAPFIRGSAVCLNVNIPNLPEKKIKGVRFTHQAHSPYVDSFHRRRDPRGRLYFWMDGDRSLSSPNGHGKHRVPTDVEAVKAGYVSITPLRLSMTCEETFERLAKGSKGPARR